MACTAWSVCGQPGAKIRIFTHALGTRTWHSAGTGSVGGTRHILAPRQRMCSHDSAREVMEGPRGWRQAVRSRRTRVARGIHPTCHARGPQGSREAGQCQTTTGGAAYCAGSRQLLRLCEAVADCVDVCGPGAACVQCAAGCPETGGDGLPRRRQHQLHHLGTKRLSPRSRHRLSAWPRLRMGQGVDERGEDSWHAKCQTLTDPVLRHDARRERP